MLKIFLLCAFLGVAYSGFLNSGGAGAQYFQLVPAQAKPAISPTPIKFSSVITKEDETPKPYAFDYSADGEDGGSSSRRESQDGSGRVSGSYTITDPDGRKRIVEYIADANGYRATIRTNEIGTESQSPADTSLESSAPTAKELAEQYGPQAPTNRIALKTYQSPAPATYGTTTTGAKKYILVPVNY